MTDIAANLTTVRQQMADACLAAGRQPQDVTLIAVSKGHGAEAIRAAYAAGQRDFGENYVQEWQEKAAALADLTDLRWHFLGHLQRNKIRHVIGHVAVLHSADDMAGIDEMQRAAWSQNKQQDVLLQVNLAQETQKRGCGEDDAELFADVLLRSPNLRLRGLMTLPPLDADPEQARGWFQRLKRLRDALALRLRGRPGAPAALWLSMGMSGDFAVAIAEGATHVRVGTAVFGARPPKGG
jgi:hypothetical protein